ncbi:hypothetical protein ANO14919_102980 [Xylariales sp. No.14919]|nr:hypothetical protein ANO14919_102980 [Xylariales sp. No.14919]
MKFFLMGSLLSTVSSPCACTTIPGTPASVAARTDGLPNGWSYVGCWSDDVKYPQLGGSAYEATNLTRAACVNWCDSKQYAYSGLKDGSYCYCGTAIKSKSVSQDESHCATPCSGCEDGEETCGGPDSLSLFHNPIHTVYTNPGPECSTSLGCFAQKQGIPALDYKLPVEDGPLKVTVAKCVKACNARDYAFAGLEQSNNCYCGAAIQESAHKTTDPYGCGYRCTGNAAEWCGGVDHMNIYQLGTCSA